MTQTTKEVNKQTTKEYKIAKISEITWGRAKDEEIVAMCSHKRHQVIATKNHVYYLEYKRTFLEKIKDLINND